MILYIRFASKFINMDSNTLYALSNSFYGRLYIKSLSEKKKSSQSKKSSKDLSAAKNMEKGQS
ncbi:MAG: hypothetical protein Wins2KO_19370 [Winogradskyella sp.]